MGALVSDDPLGGPDTIVEIDGTLIGGPCYEGNKTTVVVMRSVAGELVTGVVSCHRGPRRPYPTVCADEFGSYRRRDTCGFDQKTVNYKSGQYGTAYTA